RAHGRVALVIGNANYEYVGAPRSAANDAAAIADLLSHAGFDVVQQRSDLDDVEFWRALEDFSTLTSGADVAFFFYSGYALAVGGVDYLVPVDSKLSSATTREDEAISLDWVFRATDNARTLSLVIIDACRDSPFHPASETPPATAGASLRPAGPAPHEVSPGLAGMRPPDRHTLIAFADKPASVCVEGAGPNSPFTAGLVKYLKEPGLDVAAALSKVREEVLRTTENRQEPSVYGSLNEPVSLAAEGVAGAAADVAGASGGAKGTSAASAPLLPSATGVESSIDMTSTSAVEAPVALQAASEAANRSSGATTAAAQAAPVEPAPADANAQSSAMKSAGAEEPAASSSPPSDAENRPTVDLGTAIAEATPVRPSAVADVPKGASPDAKSEGAEVRSGASSPPAKLASLTPDEICKRDEVRLEGLRAGVASEDVHRVADEFGCEKLRPQLQRLMDSLGAKGREEGAPPPARSGEENSASVGPAEASDCRAAQATLAGLRSEPSAEAALQFWHELHCDRLRPQVRLLLESLNVLTDPPSACRRETEELNRIRMNLDRSEAKRFAHEMTCDALKPQAARLLESLKE
ncbi:MAG TPA: caspase family protein, partial [Roseiarcus sp.]|nr:caspase family protein [Roseiarcus sp.]